MNPERRCAAPSRPTFTRLCRIGSPLVLVLVVWGLYLPSISSEFVYDDEVLIVDAPRSESPADLVSVLAEQHYGAHLPYYRPIPRFSMAVQKWIHGNRPLPFHAFNVALIGMVALAAFGLLRSRGFRCQPLPAALGTALITLHPAASSAVYAITGRETLLLAGFSMVAVTAFLRCGRGWQTIASISLAAALLCKEQAAMIPALFVWADLLKLSEEPPGGEARRWLRRYLPVAVVVTLYAVCRSQVLTGPSPRLALWEAPFGPLLSCLYVLQTLFVPFVGLVYEPGAVDVWWSGVRLAGAAVVTAGMGAAAIRRWDECSGPVLFGLGWAVLMTLPIANVFAQEAKYAERYAWTALPGLVGIAAALASESRFPLGARPVALGLGGALVAITAVISLQRAEYFSSERMFVDQWVRTSPRSAQAQAALGEHLVRNGRFAEAIEPYRRARDLLPGVAHRHFALGNALRLAGRQEEAIDAFRHALQIDPDHLGAHLNLGRMLRQQGRWAEAAALYESWLERNPDDAAAQRRLDQLRMEQRRETRLGRPMKGAPSGDARER